MARSLTARLEAAEATAWERRLDSETRRFVAHDGCSYEEARQAVEKVLTVWARCERDYPPIPQPDGRLNVEPLLRAAAHALDIDPDELLAEAEKIAGVERVP